MEPKKLFMVLLGCKPAGRNTEQHDLFFGIGGNLKQILPGMLEFWPEAKGNLHIDAWREVTVVDGFSIRVSQRSEKTGNGEKTNNHPNPGVGRLFFINLGGYKEKEFEEFHYKTLIVAGSLEEAKARAKKAAFYKHTSVPESANSRQATAHIDDKYGIDVDDIYPVQEILPPAIREKYEIHISETGDASEDPWHLGYLQLIHI